MKHLKAMYLNFAEGRAVVASKLLCELSRVRVSRLPPLWDGGVGAAAAGRGWSHCSGSSTWTHTFKSARALRGAADVVNSVVTWNDVAKYTAHDASTGAVVVELDVGDVSAHDGRLHCRLNRPIDLVVELEVKANGIETATPSEEGSSDLGRVHERT